MTNAPTQDPESLTLEYDLDEAPEKVWRALTDPALVAAWLEPPTNTTVEREILEAEPERRLSYSWRETPEGGRPLDSIVTFEITPQPGGGSHLRLVHRELETVGAGALVGKLVRAANDNRQFNGWSLAWAA